MCQQLPHPSKSAQRLHRLQACRIWLQCLHLITPGHSARMQAISLQLSGQTEGVALFQHSQAQTDNQLRCSRQHSGYYSTGQDWSTLLEEHLSSAAAAGPVIPAEHAQAPLIHAARELPSQADLHLTDSALLLQELNLGLLKEEEGLVANRGLLASGRLDIRENQVPHTAPAAAMGSLRPVQPACAGMDSRSATHPPHMCPHVTRAPCLPTAGFWG